MVCKLIVGIYGPFFCPYYVPIMSLLCPYYVPIMSLLCLFFVPFCILFYIIFWVHEEFLTVFRW